MDSTLTKKNIELEKLQKVPPDDHDKDRENDLNKEIEEIKRKLASRDNVKNEMDVLKEQITTELEKIYTESATE